MKRKFNTGEWL